MHSAPQRVSTSWHDPNRICLAATLALLALLAALLAVRAPASSAPGALAALTSSRACAAQERASCATAVRRVESIGVTVSDMERSLAFYMGVLGFELVADRELVGDEQDLALGLFGTRRRVCTLRLGSELLELTEFLVPRGRPIPADSRSNDRWFQHIAIIVSDMDAAYEHLRTRRVRHVSTGPQRIPDWNPAAGGVKAFYFNDPDDHVLEILWFPPGRGLERWQPGPDDAVARPLFLGIDHTAIVVADTDRSVMFYRDVLGMEVVGSSENHGSEQEHLNHMFGARVRITTLRAAGVAEAVGPAVELLEYLSPAGGRDAPSDSRPNDLWHWHVAMSVADSAATAQLLRAASVRIDSALGAPPSVEGAGMPVSPLLLRDPDGHALVIASGSRVDSTRASK